MNTPWNCALNWLAAGWLMVATGEQQAQESSLIDSVTKAQGQLWIERAGVWDPLTSETKMPYGVVIETNGTFKVEKGKPRELLEGQVIRADGNLLNPDGTIMPVFDHLAMKFGKIRVVIDGKDAPLTAAMAVSDGSTFYPDGNLALPDGWHRQLVDGQLFKLDGSWLPMKDTITLKKGKVFVQRDGALLSLLSFQIMGMSDGTLVHGNGTVVLFGGEVIMLQENQTVLVDGAAVQKTASPLR
jgi:hypothetical protein